MARRYATFLLGLGLAAGLACGRKGPLELPRGREPMAVEGLAAFERGETIVLEWTNPSKAVSGHPLGGLEAVEVWVFELGPAAGGRALPAAEVEKLARLVRRIPKEEFGQHLKKPGDAAGRMAFVYSPSSAAAAPKNPAFTLRVIDAKGRASEFSPPVAAAPGRENASVGPPAEKGNRL